jgi:membrane-bound lytic murein transglycosylase F
MVIASYNSGVGHIQDARALCVKYKLDPNIWEDNVEKMILAKSNPKFYNDPVCKHGYCKGHETITYVHNILFYYNNYKIFYK